MIAVIDYGLGNLRSVSKALESAGAKVDVTSNVGKIAGAKAIVLPGVGAFYKGMQNLKKMGLVSCILESIKDGKPFLGICLGMQLLFTESEEHTNSKGLNVFAGSVKRFKNNLKIPHMGWNQIEKVKSQKSKIKSNNSKFESFDLLRDIPNNSYFYFVHSYHVKPKDKSIIVATTQYGEDFVSAINKDNLWGVQFHPEKSGRLGLKILEGFYNYVR